MTGIDGISFLPELLQKKQKKHKYLYFEYPEKGGQIAIRLGDWKGVKSNLKKNPAAPWELYHLQSDLGETKNLAKDHQQILKKLDAIVKKEHRDSKANEPAWQFVNEVILQMK